MGPYEIAARTYFEAGFSPLPAIGKLLYVTGYSGRYPIAPLEQVEHWIRTIGDRNIALRLPKSVIGIDIDAYKSDLIKLKELEHYLGKLPPTWNSDSRGGEGGKLLYRVPEFDKWKSNINGITIIQHTHRYIMAFPSHNKESNSRYRWYMGLGGAEVLDYEIPEIRDLTILPSGWIRELKKEEVTNQYDNTNTDLYLSDLDIFADGPMCPYMEMLTMACKDKLLTSYSGGLHDTGLSVIGKLISAATNGHTGIVHAIEQISEVFFASGRNRDLGTEWYNLLLFSLAHVPIDEISQVDSCGMRLGYPQSSNQNSSLILSIDEEIEIYRSAGLTVGQIFRFNRLKAMRGPNAA